MTDRILFVDDVAQMLRRSAASVRWMVANNTIPHGRLGGRLIFRESQIEEFIAKAFEEVA